MRRHPTPASADPGRALTLVLSFAPWVVLAAGLAACFTLWRYLSLQSLRTRNDMLINALGRAQDGILQRLEADETLLDSASLLMASRPSRDQWQAQLAAIHPWDHHPELALLAFLPASASLEADPWVTPDPLHGTALRPSELLRQPLVRKLLSESVEKGVTLLSGRVDVPGGRGVHPGYLMVRPLYRNGLPSSTRGRGLSGWIVAGFSSREAFQGILAGHSLPGLRLQLFDDSGTGLVYNRGAGLPRGSALEPGWSQNADFGFAGRTWSLAVSFAPGGGMAGTRFLPPLPVAGGLAATVLCFGLTLVLARGHSRLAELTRQLRESEEGFRAMAETASCAIIIFSENIEYINPAGAAALGWSPEELIGRPRQDVVHPLDWEWLAKRWELRGQDERLTHRYEFRVLTRRGEMRWMDVSVSNITLRGQCFGLAMAIDVTDRIKAGEERLAFERRLLDAQKLESLGFLAGGVAHDFNNLLAVIQGNTGLLREEDLDHAGSETCFNKIEEACARAADLIRQMLAYAGQGQLELRAMDLNHEISCIHHLLSVSLPEGALVNLQLDGGLPAMRGDPSQVQQIVLSLVSNAAEALKDGKGRISVRTSTAVLEASALSGMRAAEAMRPGKFLLLEVEDDGHGMDEETQARVFDPFFTTKFAGRGLGLAAMQGIVRSHHGGVRMRSEPGRGTSIHVYFPALEHPLEALPARPPADPLKFEGRVLVADHEPGVRDVVRMFLESAGFEVIQALDGMEALRLFQAHGDQLALVVLDGSMPRLGGVEALTRMRLIRPDLPALLVNGWGVDNTPEGVESLAKPFTRQGLLEAVRRALAGP